MTEITLGWYLMGMGLGGVFVALILFYLLIKILSAVANRKKSEG
nr:OadG family protein [Maliibacterium massiliense]